MVLLTSDVLPAAPILLLYSIGIYVTIVVTYRVFFHPLSQYPGPFWAKITDLYSLYHANKEDRHIDFLRCHMKYGPVFRYGPNSLSFNDVSALKSIYGPACNTKKAVFYGAFLPSTHSVTNRDVHARKKRVLSPAFSQSALNGMEEYILQVVETFCTQLSNPDPNTSSHSKGGPKHKGTTLDLGLWSSYFTFDVLGELCFGQSFNMLTSTDNHYAKELLSDRAKMLLVTGCYPAIKSFNIVNLLLKGATAGLAAWSKMCQSLSTKRMQLDPQVERKDFMHYLANAKDVETGESWSKQEIWQEVGLLIAAGADTSSTAIAATFHYLLYNPQVLKKVEEEVRSNFETVQDIRFGPAMNNCTYLRAVIEESMRISPPLPGILPRTVLHGDIKIDDMVIPEGTEVGVAPYAIHHNPLYFPDPERFRPERWLEASELENNRSAFCAFSLGSRGCLGRVMAYTEILDLLARVVFLFDISLPEGLKPGDEGKEYAMEDRFICEKVGPVVVFVERPS